MTSPAGPLLGKASHEHILPTLTRAQRARPPMLPKTNRPGDFAIADGSLAIAFVHQGLHE